MIELYRNGTTDFSRHGIALHANQAEVNYQDNGRYDLDIVMPYDERIGIDYGMIIRSPVPKQHIGAITLGTVSYWEVSEGQGVAQTISTTTVINYPAWQSGREYAQGEKVTFANKNYQASTAITNVLTTGAPPSLPNNWTQIARTGSGGTYNTGVPLYATVPVRKTISYTAWEYGKEYAQGDKVSYNKKNYQASTAITGVLTTGAPPVLPNNWTEIPRQQTSGGKVAAYLSEGAQLIKTGDYNKQYMQAADLSGNVGFIEISRCTDLSETETRTYPAQDISEQNFVITGIRKSTDKKTISIHAEHVSYQLARTLLGECNITRANPATALLFIQGAMMEEYPGSIYTNMTDQLITGDMSWKNAQNAVMDPKAGFLQATGARMIRNDLDVFLLAEEDATPRYSITYGVNLKKVRWDGDVGDIVTRIYPLAQTEDGSTLMLPEEYIDTVRTVPFVRPEPLRTGLKVGQKEKQADGSEIELTQDMVFARMRDAAGNRFSIDKCDRAKITLEVDWEHLPDTEEYKEYAALQNCAPGDWAQVTNLPMGISESIQLTGYTFDAIRLKYKKGTFGEKTAGGTIAGYELSSGSVSGRVLAAGAVGSQNLMADSITAREILAGSITADKIASRSIVTELLAANSITAEEILAGSITAEKIAAQAITAEKIAAGAITAQAIDSEVITTRHLAADAITAEKIAAGAVEASKIAALAVTAEKIAAQAITADKIASGSISAGKIDTTDLEAINAVLGTADIADARIQAADIDFAKVKDLTAGSAYFGQAVIQAGVANKLFIPRLSVDYAQVVSATIGDLVIQASNNNYYKLDVDLAGCVTATQVTPSAAEIAAGHTSDGRTIYTATGITASELNTTDVYASHALMDTITAEVINTDQLFAREATIAHINAMDLSSNTYIQSVVGDWTSGSTITQTISGINSRINQLGYGTIYYSETEPSHAGLVAGDIWIQPIDDNTWDEIGRMTWDQVGQMTWDAVMGEYRMYAWTGQRWRQLFDNLFITDLQTQIDQNAQAITLKANQTAVDTLSGEVTSFRATLEVQGQAIMAAVETVNAKTSGFVQYTDPSLEHEVHLGDTWVKTGPGSTWDQLAEMTWNEIADYTWDDLAGSKTYVWNGTEWIPTSDQASIVTMQTRFEQTDRQISLMAEEQLQIGNDVFRNSAEIRVMSDRITQEVERAQNAENGKIAKTSTLQTADEIVTEAVRQSTSSAAGLYLEKTTQYQTASAIVTEAVRQSANAAEGSYLKKTSQYQTADAIVSAAETYTNGQLVSYSTTTQTSALISAYVTNNAYRIQSGIAIEAAGVTISGGKYVKIESSGIFNVTAATFGIRSASSEAYAIWAGASAAASSPFRVKPDGTVYLTKLIALNEQGQESEVNLRTSGLWKLNYATIKAITLANGFVESMTFSNAISGNTTVNFRSAAAATLVAAALGVRESGTKATFGVLVTRGDGTSTTVNGCDCTKAYNLGWLAARDNQTTIGTCYEITAHQGDWVKVRSLGTGYSRVGATPQ